MKKQLIALSLLALPGLMAQEAPAPNDNNGYTYSQNGASGTCGCNPCSCNPCCCKPCCVPQPKQCINCECYVPSYYDLQCDWGFFASVDFLYWYAKEANLAYAAETVSVQFTPETKAHTPLALTQGYVVPTKYKDLEAKWDPGVRVGLGWNTDCDGWDAYLNWTWFHNKKHKSTSLESSTTLELFPMYNGDTLLNDPWVDPAVFNGLMRNITPFFDHMTAKWTLNFNSIDLEFGRKFWLSRCFTMRPYAGLRGAWTTTRFKVKGTLAVDSGKSKKDEFFDEEVSATVSAKDNFKNKLWGVGFIGGFQPNWHFWSNFILFGNFEGSLIWGDFHSSKKSKYRVKGDVIGIEGSGESIVTLPIHATRNFAKMSAILDLALGLRWEEQWCCYRYMTALDIGWEHHIWINHGTYVKNISGVVVVPPAGSDPKKGSTNPTGNVAYTSSLIEETKDLGFGGLVIRLRFDF